jgi:recombinational DNA repair protein RecT
MNVSEVYEDELVDYNPITGEIKLTKVFTTCTQRKKAREIKS